MPRLSPVSWQTLKCIFEKDGFRFERENSSHLVLSKQGVSRPVIVPKYRDIDKDIIKVICAQPACHETNILHI